MKQKRNVIQNILLGTCMYFLFLAGNRLAYLAIEFAKTGEDAIHVVMDVTQMFLPSFIMPKYGMILPNFGLIPILCGGLALGGIIIAYLYGFKKRKNFREQEEHGSARYGDLNTEADKLRNKDDPKYEVIYSKHVAVSMNTRQTFLNNNTLTIGGSGSGKTRFHVKPNALNLSYNYVITDPKDSLVKEIGNAFFANDYDMKYLNLVNFSRSMHYNPLKYIYEPNDILKFVNNLVAATTKNKQSAGGDQFFEMAEIALLTACMFYLFATTEFNPKDRNLNSVMDLIDAADASEEDENMQSVLDIMFIRLEEWLKDAVESGYYTEIQSKNSWSHLAIRQYNLYKKAAGKTAKSILISVGVRMAVFNLPEMVNLLGDDEIDLESIGAPRAMPKWENKDERIQAEWKGHKVFLDKNGNDCILAREYDDPEGRPRYRLKSTHEELPENMEPYLLTDVVGTKQYEWKTITDIFGKKEHIPRSEYTQELASVPREVMTEMDWEKFYVDMNGNMVEPQLQKTVLFVAVSDSDSTFYFLAAILYQQLFDILYRLADSRPENRLPIHTRFILDEFANTGRFNDFAVKIATMRSREISVDVILQNLAQLKSTYKEEWETIEGNCDVTLFLGGKEYSTLERLSKIIGNETVDYLSISETKGGSSSGSYSQSNQLISRNLLAPDEIGRLKPSECLIHVRGYHIFRDEKYDLMQHPNIHFTSDYDDANMFDTNKLRMYFIHKDEIYEDEDIEDQYDEDEYDEERDGTPEEFSKKTVEELMQDEAVIDGDMFESWLDENAVPVDEMYGHFTGYSDIGGTNPIFRTGE